MCAQRTVDIYDMKRPLGPKPVQSVTVAKVIKPLSEVPLKNKSEESHSSAPSEPTSPSNIIFKAIKIDGSDAKSLSPTAVKSLQLPGQKNSELIFEFPIRQHPMSIEVAKHFVYFMDAGYNPRMIGGPLIQSLFRAKYLVNDNFTIVSNHFPLCNGDVAQINHDKAATYWFEDEGTKINFFHCYRMDEWDLVKCYMKTCKYYNNFILATAEKFYVSASCLIALFYDVVIGTPGKPLKMTDDEYFRYKGPASEMATTGEPATLNLIKIIDSKPIPSSISSSFSNLVKAYHKLNYGKSQFEAIWKAPS